MSKRVITVEEINCINVQNYMPPAYYNDLTNHFIQGLKSFSDMYAVKMSKAPQLKANLDSGKFPVQILFSDGYNYTFQFLTAYMSADENEYKDKLKSIFNKYYYTINFILLNRESMFERWLSAVDINGSPTDNTQTQFNLFTGGQIIDRLPQITEVLHLYREAKEVKQEWKMVDVYLQLISPVK